MKTMLFIRTFIKCVLGFLLLARLALDVVPRLTEWRENKY